MRIPRVYQDSSLKAGETVQLNSDAANHIANVLRLSKEAPLILFNGKGGEFSAKISSVEKRKVMVIVEKFYDAERESPLKIHLAQAVSRGDKMDFTIQKAVELGVTEITLILTERCGVKLSQDRWEKRLEHWRKIIINASEQCGRNCLALLHPPLTLDDYLNKEIAEVKLVLDCDTEKSFHVANAKSKEVALLIGPEGGLTKDEIFSAQKNHFLSTKLGNRILRTETAGIAIISILQNQWGDLD